jgi:linear primary-alkylsulfatase
MSSSEVKPVAPIEPRDAEPATRALHARLRAHLPFDDRRDFEDARRGFVATHESGVIRSARGAVLWNLPAYRFLDGEDAPPTVNPSLWRIARLNLHHGLFEVAPGVFQVRGFDIANMTILEGKRGVIVIDPLTATDTARAALELYYAHRPRRPVSALIYSHSHTDHYGGVKGVITEHEVASGEVEVIAPVGFLEAVAGEAVLAGNPMLRRAQYQFGSLLPQGPRAQVDAGLGKAIARGVVSLIAPTREIVEPVETHVVDGVEIVFHLAPGTEAPSEMHMYHPQFRVLNMAENATRHLHNFCPIRGAVVRDPRMWSYYLSDALERFADSTDILIGQHHWPTWGRERVRDFLEKQRDLYKYLHDQTVRLMNHGYKPAEIAESLDLPPELAREWGVRGYYGTVSHNAKAVYQRYLSWYDGNPANLNPLPPVEQARKAVEYMGGADAVLARGRADFARGEYRWVAQVANQLVFAQPENRAARDLAADAFEQLGYQAESATWRNAYLFGAQELRQGIAKLPPRPMLSPDLVSAIATSTLFDFVAVRLNPERAGGQHFVINWTLADTGECVVLTLSRSALTHLMGKRSACAAAHVTTTRAVLIALITRETTVAEAVGKGEASVEGDAVCVGSLFDMLDDFSMQFAVVEPRAAPWK